ncbi:hypothetical protein PFICI_01610 [Pestalotiopsis fici W106-1]|uniref:Xylanolytic transcriptional activator regulatory domain-containing protein n=1 Tax=Pestalotiopsis fici (strain W106-1 / CGMCC3.15140) TaxID=1229662 RepID=W3XQJ0_PESFW|nr:uncharacterized protein PFICI_01610 [Pestalotiopsis fici W106-1]ETS87782.1 hypothetical protein PFICI_01610 [Pestalotiopsis fici W106-1]
MRHGEECNITDCVAYSYRTVEHLLGRIQDLERRLAAVSSTSASEAVNRTDRSTSVAQSQDKALSKEAEEIGILAIGGPSPYSEGAYVGSASGSTFARIFFKQLSLTSDQFNGASLGRDAPNLSRDLTSRQASLPSQSIAKHLLTQYIARVHVWWPFLAVPFLRNVFNQIYQDPQQSSDYEKFLVFAVLALASREAAAGGVRTMDLNSPSSYYQTCLNFFSGFRERASARKLPSIHATLLLGLWLLDAPNGLAELWHLSRHAMSSAIEAGLHRHNTDWGLGDDEMEIRNRTWWSVYNLERQVATMTGRVLSIRDHAIETPLPMLRKSLDSIAGDDSATIGRSEHESQIIEPFRRMIELRKLSGRILESVYVRRNEGRGNHRDVQTDSRLNDSVNTSLQQICAQADAIALELSAWDERLSSSFLSPLSPMTELRIESCLLQLLLYRPSPVFMIPSSNMTTACGRAARTAIAEWNALQRQRERDGTGGAVCRSVRQLHGVLTAGLAALYCDWRTARLSTDPTRLLSGHLWLESDTRTCLDLIERGIVYVGEASFGRYRDMFRAARLRVYLNAPSSARHNPSSAGLSGMELETGAPGIDDGLPLLGGEIDSYINQVSDLFDGGTFELDEALNDWYATLMQGTWTPVGAEDAGC